MKLTAVTQAETLASLVSIDGFSIAQSSAFLFVTGLRLYIS